MIREFNFESALKADFEGGLFRHRWISTTFGKTYCFHEDLYTVINGFVYIIEDEKITATGDDIKNLCSIERIGDFNPIMAYPRRPRIFWKHKEFEAFLRKKECEP